MAPLAEPMCPGQLWPLEVTQLWEGLCQEATLWSRRGLGPLYPTESVPAGHPRNTAQMVSAPPLSPLPAHT